MRTMIAGSLALLLAGCAMGSMRIELTSRVRPGETVDVVEMTTTPASDFSVRFTNLGPVNPSAEGGEIVVSNGDEVLGRLEAGESRTFTISGRHLRLRVRGERNATRFEGLVLGNPR